MTDAAHSQTAAYPAKPIRMIVPVLPGGAPDFGGRIVAERLSLRLGQKVVVENRAGAGGIITDWSGGPATNGGAIIASGDKRVHEQALALLTQG